METHGNYMIILLGMGVQFDFYKLIFESSKIELGQTSKKFSKYRKSFVS